MIYEEEDEAFDDMGGHKPKLVRIPAVADLGEEVKITEVIKLKSNLPR